MATAARSTTTTTSHAISSGMPMAQPRAALPGPAPHGTSSLSFPPKSAIHTGEYTGGRLLLEDDTAHVDGIRGTPASPDPPFFSCCPPPLSSGDPNKDVLMAENPVTEEATGWQLAGPALPPLPPDGLPCEAARVRARHDSTYGVKRRPGLWVEREAKAFAPLPFAPPGICIPSAGCLYIYLVPRYHSHR
jgi:hypothetical protein